MPNQFLIERYGFWSKVEKTATCWLWRGGKNNRGYGTLHGGTDGLSHRIAYELARGPIPQGFHIDHLCRVRDCVNPDHLEAVTCRENLRRGDGFTGRRARQTHCIHGHPLSGDNLYISPANGTRKCRACRHAAYQRKKARRPLAA